MATRIVLMQSWDHHSTSQITKKWNALLGDNFDFIPPIVTADAARKGYGLATRRGGQAWASFEDLTTFSVGFAYRTMGIETKRIIGLRDEDVIQLYLQLSSAGKVQVFRGNGTLIGTSAQTISAAKFYHIELQAVISSTIGTIVLRINGQAALGFSATSVNTQVSTIARVNILTCGDATTAMSYSHFDDIFLTDGGMIGPAYVDPLFPNGGVDNYMQWETIGGAGSAYQAINERIPDDDTSYLYSPSAAIGGTHLSEFEDIRKYHDIPIPGAPGGAIFGVAIHGDFRKEYGSTRGVRQIIWSAGTHDGASGSLISFGQPSYMETDFAYQSDYYSQNPAASSGLGGTWSVQSVNALRAGMVRYV